MVHAFLNPDGLTMVLSYINIFVRDLGQAVRFYSETLGFEVLFEDADFGYASFQTGPVRLAVAATDDEALVGRHTGIGFAVDDLIAAHQALAEKGVEFSSPPQDQPWGGFMAILLDPDGNSFYLDQVDLEAHA